MKERKKAQSSRNSLSVCTASGPKWLVLIKLKYISAVKPVSFVIKGWIKAVGHAEHKDYAGWIELLMTVKIDGTTGSEKALWNECQGGNEKFWPISRECTG